MRSRLVLPTWDGSLHEVKISPLCGETQVEFQIRYYKGEGGEERSVAALLRFHQVASLDMEVNCFDQPVGADLGGFYEILDGDFKKQLLEKVFENRKTGYLFHGSYDYDPEDPADMLNFRGPVEAMLRDVDGFHLYQLQAMGGICHILSRDYELVEREELDV